MAKTKWGSVMNFFHSMLVLTLTLLGINAPIESAETQSVPDVKLLSERVGRIVYVF
jgi:hypothetical protein